MPAWSAHPEVRRIVKYLWVLVLLTLAWFVSLISAIKAIAKNCNHPGDYYYNLCQNVYSGASWSLLPDTAGITSLAKIIVVDDAGGQSHTGLPLAAGFAIVFILMMGFQSVLTMGLHCADLLVTMSRDEDTWRKAYRRSGYAPQNALSAAFGSCKSLALFALKPLVH